MEKIQNVIGFLLFLLFLSLELVSSEGFSFTIENVSERMKKFLKVSNTLDTTRNHFSLATQH